MGEARHPGPPRQPPRQTTEDEEEHLFGDGETPAELFRDPIDFVPRVDTEAILDDLFLMHDPEDVTQGTSDVDATPLGVSIPPDVEMLSPMEGDVLGVGDHESHSKPYGRGNGKHTDIFVGRFWFLFVLQRTY